MGYFSTAYSFYNVIFSIATAGFPVAVSRMVSESDSLGRWRDVRRIRSVALPVFMLTGLIGTVLMLLSAPFYTRAVGNPGALPAMLMLAPSVLLCSIAAAFRGYCEGLRSMTPTAVSQVIEAAVKLVFGLSGAYFVMSAGGESLAETGLLFGFALPADIPHQRMLCALGAAAAILGVTLGSGCSALYLFLHDLRGDGISEAQIKTAPEPRPKRTLVKILIGSSLPIAVGAVAMSVSGLIDASFLQTRIAHILRTDPDPLLSMYAGSIPQENLAESETIPNYLFGCYNMALTLFMLVPSITQAFGMSALPSVTRAYTRGVRENLKKAMETVLRMTCIFALPAGLGLSVLAEPIARLVYGDRVSTPIIGAALSVMGIAAIFAAVTTPLGSMLQAVGRIELPVILTLCGLLIKVILNYILAGIPTVNILGGGISTLISYALVTVAEWIALCRITRIRFDIFAVLIKPVGAALLCAAAACSAERAWAYFGISGRPATVLSVLTAAIMYAIALVLFGAVNSEDRALFSGKEKNVKTQQKHLKNTGG